MKQNILHGKKFTIDNQGKDNGELKQVNCDRLKKEENTHTKRKQIYLC